MKPRQFAGFEATGQTEKVCFNGWDGKSYNGESEVLPTYRHNFPGCIREKVYVPKYSRQFKCWTMHEVHYDWDKIGDAYNVDYRCEVEKIA